MERVLRRATIKNFQSVGEITIDFSKYTTAITGPNDTGKTACLRGIKTAVTNVFRPGWLRRGKKGALVELEFDDAIVRWMRKGGKGGSSSYEVESPKGTLLPTFSKTGRSVPEEVSKILDFGFIQIDEGRKIPLNLAGQWDAPFLVSESGPVVSQVLGKISGIDSIYAVIKRVASDNSDIEKKVKEISLDIDRHKENKKSWDTYVSTMQEIVSLVDATYDSLQKKQQQREKVLKLEQGINNLLTTLDSVNTKISRLPPDLKPKTVDLEQLFSKSSVLKTKMDGLTRLQLENSRIESRLSPLAGIHGAKQATTSLETSILELSKKKALRASLVKVKEEYLNLKGKLESLNPPSEESVKDISNRFLELSKAKEKLNKITLLNLDRNGVIRKLETLDEEERLAKEVLKEFKTCPLCQSPMPEVLV